MIGRSDIIKVLSIIDITIYTLIKRREDGVLLTIALTLVVFASQLNLIINYLKNLLWRIKM